MQIFFGAWYLVLFVIATTTNAPLDDYDTDVATEENDDSSQPKEKKSRIAKGKIIFVSFKCTL